MVDIPTGYFVAATGGSFLFGLGVAFLLTKLFGGGKGSTTTFEHDEKYKERLIRDARDFTELYDALRRIGPIRGTSRSYNTDELIDLIGVVEATELSYQLKGKQVEIYKKTRDNPLSYVTRAYGLRDKVEELIKKDKAKQPR